ncbi:hypothetical protein Moror_16026 [Moniliophthora roreri MCA 2997]|uniref:UbiA prenyltransferase n=1 Tax=Moniliophthora roreri (strain MCA 2997) TaxID=1381753 RepID=V2XJL5_MONRO|nr:hypothetical protein Moror_16026 [Moniliophthora roreri MCA 2997]
MIDALDDFPETNPLDHPGTMLSYMEGPDASTLVLLAPDVASILIQRCIQVMVDLVRIAHAFSKSDYKTIIIPVTCYGILASAQFPDIATMLNLLVWIWMFLLQFCAANQMHSIREDFINKPYRPIPSGLISVQATYKIRWILVPTCLYLSWVYRVFCAGLSLTLSFALYNEFGLDSYWYSKSLLNAIGIVSWNIGAALIISTDHYDLLGRYQIAPLISVALIWTTIHVQDFRDEAGDRMQGRITLPTFLPVASRYLTLCLLTSCVLQADDKVPLRLYMVWLTLAQTLPFLAHRLQAV